MLPQLEPYWIAADGATSSMKRSNQTREIEEHVLIESVRNESLNCIARELKSCIDDSFHDMEVKNSLGLMIDEWFDARVELFNKKIKR